MPIYEFTCDSCGTIRDVLADYESLQELELLCIECGGVMNSNQIHMFQVITGSTPHPDSAKHKQNVRSCGHSHACRCSIKMNKPNPFQKEVEQAMGVKKK